MQEFRDARTIKTASYDASIDKGLRAYMIGVYNLMAMGLGITGLTAYLVSSFSVTHTAGAGASAMLRNGLYLTEFGKALYMSPLSYVIMFAPLVAVLFLSFKIHNLRTSTARALFLGYAALVGLSLSSIFLVYTSTSITQTFFITAAAFASLSLYGYTTKRDLRPIGSFLCMMAFGLLIAMVVNLFLKSSGFQFIITLVGLGIFSGLTAYDTQRTKELYYEGDSSETMGRKMVLGALSLYLDFINMFVFLLQFLNSNRE